MIVFFCIHITTFPGLKIFYCLIMTVNLMFKYPTWTMKTGTNTTYNNPDLDNQYDIEQQIFEFSIQYWSISLFKVIGFLWIYECQGFSSPVKWKVKLLFKYIRAFYDDSNLHFCFYFFIIQCQNASDFATLLSIKKAYKIQLENWFPPFLVLKTWLFYIVSVPKTSKYTHLEILDIIRSFK